MAKKAAAKKISHTPGDVEVMFVEDYAVKEEDGTEYHKGEKIKMSEASAFHFTKRELAIDSTDKVAMAAFRRVEEGAESKDDDDETEE